MAVGVIKALHVAVGVIKALNVVMTSGVVTGCAWNLIVWRSLNAQDLLYGSHMTHEGGVVHRG